MIQPFSNIQGSVGDLEIDNADDVVTISGHLRIEKTQEGLQKAMQLLSFMQSVVHTLDHLDREESLPLDFPQEEPVMLDNPFESGDIEENDAKTEHPADPAD